MKEAISIKMTCATWLTVVRLLLAPCIVFFLARQELIPAIVCFVIALMTDLFDGFIARWDGHETVFGALLDPLADKVLLVSSYSALWYWYDAAQLMPWWFLSALLVREGVILGGAAWTLMMQGAVHRDLLRPSRMGKWTMTIHGCLLMLWLVTLLFPGCIDQRLTYVMFRITGIVMGISMVQYMVRWFKYQFFSRQHAVIAGAWYLFYFLMLGMFGTVVQRLFAPDETLVVERPLREGKKKQLREDLCTLFASYLEAIIEEVQLVGKRLVRGDFAEDAVLEARIHQLRCAEYFVRTGQAPVAEEKCRVETCSVGLLVEQLGVTQEVLLRALHMLLVLDTQSCFVQIRSKHLLEKAVAYMRLLLQETERHKKTLLETWIKGLPDQSKTKVVCTTNRNNEGNQNNGNV